MSLESDIFLLLHALAVAAVTCVNAYNLALVDEQRYADLGAGLQLGRLECVSSGITTQTWFGVGNGELYFSRQFGEEDRIRRCVGNDVNNKSLFQVIHTGDQVMGDRNLLVSLVVHEDVVLTLLVQELVRTTLYANIFQFLADIEAALQNATVNNVFELNAHNRVALAGFHMQKFDYEIQTAVHTDANAVLDVL